MTKEIRKKRYWKVKLLVEGEISAGLVAREEHLNTVNHDFDNYPVELELPRTYTFIQMIRKITTYPKKGICSKVYMRYK